MKNNSAGYCEAWSRHGAPGALCVLHISYDAFISLCSFFFQNERLLAVYFEQSVLTHLYTRTVGEHLLVKFVEQGWRTGDCTRLPPTWPGFGPRVS